MIESAEVDLDSWYKVTLGHGVKKPDSGQRNRRKNRLSQDRWIMEFGS